MALTNQDISLIVVVLGVMLYIYTTTPRFNGVYYSADNKMFVVKVDEKKKEFSVFTTKGPTRYPDGKLDILKIYNTKPNVDWKKVKYVSKVGNVINVKTPFFTATYTITGDKLTIKVGDRTKVLTNTKWV
jgi:hypothetical protein